MPPVDSPEAKLLAWLFIVFVTLMVVVLTRTLVINAKTILRDKRRRLDGFRTGLEREANRLLDGLLKPEDESSHDPGQRG